MCADSRSKQQRETAGAQDAEQQRHGSAGDTEQQRQRSRWAADPSARSSGRGAAEARSSWRSTGSVRPVGRRAGEDPSAWRRPARLPAPARGALEIHPPGEDAAASACLDKTGRPPCFRRIRPRRQ
ncbi:uncharacterized protein [Zea mays]|uniref:uncharacterized protein n=1 Tax=Zea mays TaxID=4577 RepID=UPI0004DEBB72|nr:uncharacterized protein LOC103646365 [Zea mays]|eukprot:XP_008669322.1 uncharacterized protein LOC103646365 [Zea mays]